MYEVFVHLAGLCLILQRIKPSV